jgi:hypothetical protein
MCGPIARLQAVQNRYVPARVQMTFGPSHKLGVPAPADKPQCIVLLPHSISCKSTLVIIHK